MESVVSIIMPMFNAGNFIKESIDSILNQTYRNFTLYLIDDCSTDNTLEIVNLINDSRIVILESSKNEGVSESRNKALRSTQSKYIAFCDSDDLWHREKLQKQIAILESGQYDIVGSWYSKFTDNNSEKNKIVKSPEIITFSDMLKSNRIGNLTGIYNAHKLGKVLQKKIGHEDYVMWLAMIKKSQVAYIIQETLAFYRVGNTSLSSNKIKACSWQWRIYREELNLTICKSLYYFVWYVFIALTKRI